MCSCVMRADCKHERHGTPALVTSSWGELKIGITGHRPTAGVLLHSPVVGDPEARDSRPSGTDSLALEAMSEGPLIQHSSSALIGNA
ncbi:hypothetical protein PAPYR_11392 [Paratrimastix pyriformis]|uniref:Uncharacterized protein n=1 Tax=Paratrimastix pyriformis TaxID=342808 RepID=A0ABQ8U8T3_9EUKA|nr:hypothetical protein PAPYR_11392 [Paratrimastix pyriformis]